ncbi:MAG: hypothetical protein KDC46_01460 [Thermoleophilia bacterium]|nr:hypothetical protein [Thermoleophilia bacterium]
MTSIGSIIPKVAIGAAAAGVGVGAVALASKASTEETGRRKVISGVLAGVGGLAAAGALLARNTKAFGPLLGAGIGLAAAGTIDALRGGGDAATSTPGANLDPGEAARAEKLAALKPGDLLPDGVQAAPTNVYRQGDEVRFDSVVGNRGASPFQIALHLNEQQGSSRTTQVIFNEDGTATERDLQGGLRLDERRDHNHLHFDDFVYFQLYKADENGRPDLAAGELSGGIKQSFYITDVQQFQVDDKDNLATAAKLANHGRVDRNIVDADVAQGISVGYADVYGAGLQGQSLSLGDAKPGRYVLRQSFDPSDEVLEQNEKNNVADTLIEVGADGKVTTVRSDFAPESDYVTLPDGRVVIPSVLDSLENARPHVHSDNEG